jgi:subtilase family serine protease
MVISPPPIMPVGGTSASPPTCAGLWALVDQNRRIHGHARLANAAAALYRLRGDAAFVDITVGANGYFPARAGYDNATGLGVPDVNKLVKALQ